MAARVESMGGTTLEMIMPSTVGDVQAGGREQVVEQDAPFVGGLLVHGAQAPLADQPAAVERPDGDIAIARVKSQQHVRLLQGSEFRFRRPCARSGNLPGSARAVMPWMTPSG